MFALFSLSAGTSTEAYALGVIDADTLKQILCFAFGGIGSVASGYLGSTLFPIKGMSFRQCWTINFICGFMLAPICTYYVLHKYPHFPIPITAVAMSFVLGGLGVKVIQYTLPVMLRFYEQKVGGTRKKDDQD